MREVLVGKYVRFTGRWQELAHRNRLLHTVGPKSRQATKAKGDLMTGLSDEICGVFVDEYGNPQLLGDPFEAGS